MKSTWKKCKSSNELKNSISYQKEEYAVTLCMEEFTDIVYPRKISDGLAYFMRNIEGKKPKYHHVRIQKIENGSSLDSKQTFFKEDKKRNFVPLALRMVLEQVETIMTSPEVSSSDKKIFAEEIENTISINYYKLEETTY